MPFAWNDDVKIRYRTEGAGTPLVMHHGLSGYAESWITAGYFEPLTEHKLILLDARGHGQSSKPDTSEQYSMKHMTGDVVAVLDKLNIDKTLYCARAMISFFSRGNEAIVEEMEKESGARAMYWLNLKELLSKKWD